MVQKKIFGNFGIWVFRFSELNHFEIGATALLGHLDTVTENRVGPEILQDLEEGNCIVLCLEDDVLHRPPMFFVGCTVGQRFINGRKWQDTKMFWMKNYSCPLTAGFKLERKDQVLVLFKRCATCFRTTGRLKSCGACKSAYYCSIDNQRTDWNQHKHKCGMDMSNFRLKFACP